MLEDVNDEIPLFTEREQETVMEGEPIGTPVTRSDRGQKKYFLFPFIIRIIFSILQYFDAVFFSFQD